MSLSDSWTSADYWFADFIDRLEQSATRCLRLKREAVALPDAVVAARDFEQETEQQRRYLAVERERILAEQGKTA